MYLLEEFRNINLAHNQCFKWNITINDDMELAFVTRYFTTKQSLLSLFLFKKMIVATTLFQPLMTWIEDSLQRS